MENERVRFIYTKNIEHFIIDKTEELIHIQLTAEKCTHNDVCIYFIVT